MLPRGLRIDRLLKVATTHLPVTIDENRHEELETLGHYVPQVIVALPRAARGKLHVHRLIGEPFERNPKAKVLGTAFEGESPELVTATRSLPRQAILCLI